MSRNGKVIVAMSGGVDSSVAACLLKEQGYECIGVFMRVGATAARPADQPKDDALAPPAGAPARRLKHGCCSVEDALDARAVASRLGIRFYVLNFQPEFTRIIDYFADEYARGRTPNPCVVCNTDLKFGKLLRYADALEAEFVATGHYARVVCGAPCLGAGAVGGPLAGASDSVGQTLAGAAGAEDWQPRLARARCLAKDQSYVLFGIQRAALGRCLFPLGDIEDKADVRHLAENIGLAVHNKPDSQEICFVPDQDYAALVRERRPEAFAPGVFQDRAGTVLGTHDGVANFTIGQRRGLRLAMGRPVYVTALNAADQTVTIGPEDEVLGSGLRTARVNWLVDQPAPGVALLARARIRHQHEPALGLLTPVADGTAAFRFDSPQKAITPGQAAVFYGADDIVLGGGWIEAAT